MGSILCYRAAAIIAAGLIAGAVHSAVHAEKHGRIVLRVAEPPPAVVTPKSGDPAAAPGTPAPTDPKTTPGVQTPTMTEASSTPTAPVAASALPLHVSIEQAKTLFDANAPFVDARHLADYESGHIADALLLSADDVLAGDRKETLDFLDREKPFVVYCSGGKCDASENLVMLLQQAGFKAPHIMTDGYPAWQQAGHPTETGKPLIGGGG